MKFDLHFHTTHSDGAKAPEEIVAMAKKRNIAFLACTDHDLINTDIPAFAQAAGIAALE